MRALLLALALAWTGLACANFTPPAQEVLRIAPELRGFAGSAANFESLASGLQSGKTVSLTTITSDGMREVVAFAAAGPFSAAETALLLVGAQQELAARGIASPTGWQIGIALLGGTLATPRGMVRTPGMIAAANPEKRMVLSLHTFAGSPANYKNLVAALTQGRTVTLAVPGDSRAKLSFRPPGRPLSPEKAKHSLQLAGELLAAQGINDPSPQELRAALVGGTVATPSGGEVMLRGVLEAGK